jgi:hypothetical protein
LAIFTIQGGEFLIMNAYWLNELVKKKRDLTLYYQRDRDEEQKFYHVEATEVVTERLRNGQWETYLYGVMLPKKEPKPLIRKFIVRRILSAQ